MQKTVDIVRQRVKPAKMFLMDYHVFEIPDGLKATRKHLLDRASNKDLCEFKQEAIDLMAGFAYGRNGGIGDVSGCPPGLLSTPIDCSLDACVQEWELVAFNSISRLLEKLNLDPKEIDYVIANGGTLQVVPSLSARICNRFKMRSSVHHFSVSGHGCTGGIIVMDLARHLLEAAPEKRVLIMLNENITSGWYNGNFRPFLMSVVGFRMGGAAVLLSNRKVDKKRAKYTLRQLERTLDTSDESVECVRMRSDPEDPQKKGVQVDGKMVLRVASNALKTVLTNLAPKVLPFSELVKVAKDRKHKPDFSKAFEHVVIHPGAKAVIDVVRKALGFGDKAAIPSLKMLERFGNTSTSSIFYILAYIETFQGLQKGDRVLQMAMGSGFNAGAVAWKARRDIKDSHPAWGGDPQIWVPLEEDPWAQKYANVKDDALFSTKVVEKTVVTANEQ